MSFFEALKELGQGFKEVGQVFGRDIAQIAKETKEEIAADPGKYMLDSVKEIGAAAVSTGAAIGKYALDDGVPHATLLATVKADEAVRNGQMPADRASDSATRAALGEIAHLRRLSNKDVGDLPEDIEKVIESINKSITRLRKYRGLSTVKLEPDDVADAQSAMDEASDAVSSLRERCREARLAKERAAASAATPSA